MTSKTGRRLNFYERPLDTTRERMAAAAEVGGIDEEIALIRSRLHKFARDHPDDLNTVTKITRAIVRAVAERYRMQAKDKRALEAASIAAIRELAAQFLPLEDQDV
jgi:hypothetical protein